MSKENKNNPEAPEIEYIEATKILDKAIKKIEKEQIIEKADLQKLDTEELKAIEQHFNIEEQIKGFTTYIDIAFDLIFTFINKALKKENIDPVSKEEINNLKEAILGYITDKLTIPGTKITQFFSKIIDIPKLIKVIVSIWKIVFPRLSKYFQDKKKPKDYTEELTNGIHTEKI